MTPRSRLALGAVAVTALLLSGCAPAQTTKQACTIVTKDLSDAATSLNAAFAKIADDPAGARDALVTFGTRMRTTDGKISAPDVKKPLEKAIDAVDDLSTKMTAYVKDRNTDPAPLRSSATHLQDTFTALGERCPA